MVKLKKLGLGLAILSGLLLAGCEIRHINPETGEVIIENQKEGFDATEYVNNIWKDRVIPTTRKEAAELSSLLEALDGNNLETAKQYGLNEDNPPSDFLVKGTGTVANVDTTSRVGYLSVDMTEGPEIQLQIGPVISGTALRDALPFIKFDQFTNQLEYAAVSRAMHDHLMEKELNALNLSRLAGKEITFYGAMENEKNEIVITPVIIEIAGT